jgi:hydroxyacid-oxoacid transhydrogenase
MAASNLRFGPGATSEVGQDLTDSFRCKKALVITDTNVRKLACFGTLIESLERSMIDYCIFDRVRVEPNDQSFMDAIAFAKATPYDAVVAMGGGSVLDTAKAANLYASFPQSDFWDHVNAPIGKGLPVPGAVKPLIALPTTSGTGSETTGVAIFDTNKSKTGIADRHLKPALGIVDPNNTVDQPALVTLYTGLDVLCHALESYTALPSSQRSPRPTSPLHRPAYQGSNPISDVWSLYAIQTTSEHLKKASEGNADSLFQMMLAASAAGMGFGNAGVHLCHGMSYAVSSQVKDTVPPLYPQVLDHPLIPHGLSVAVHAPTVFDYTHPANEKRHDTCAFIMGYEDLSLSEAIRSFCEDHLGVKTGLAQFGYTKDDVPQLVAATLPQHRVLRLSPRPVAKHDLERLFTEAIES